MNLQTPESSLKTPVPSIRRPSILIVDDSKMVLNALCSCFVQLGWDVTPVTLVARAIESITRQAPDIVLCDLNLGRNSGTELFDWLREERSSIPFVLMTGECDDHPDVLRLRALDVLVYHKPFRHVMGMPDHFRTLINR